MRVLEGAKAEALISKLEHRAAADLDAVEPLVRRVVAAVRKNGDRALRRYAAQWDGVGARQSLRVSQAEMDRAWREATPQFRRSLEQAAKNIRRFCEWQRPTE